MSRQVEFAPQARHDLIDIFNYIAGDDAVRAEAFVGRIEQRCNALLDFPESGYGKRRDCERAVAERGGLHGGLSQRTDYLIVGVYATESWKHSSMGNKIVKACAWRDEGVPIAIVSEEHWTRYL